MTLRTLTQTALSGLLLAGSALSGTAHAAENEFSLDVGSLASNTDSWDTFSDTQGLPSYGGRIGLKVNDRVAAIANYSFGKRGADVEIYDYEGSDEGYLGTFQSAYYGHTLALGVKADAAPWPWLRPYAAVQAMGAMGTVRLDEDTERDDNVNQIQRRAVAPGGVAALGIDLLPMGHRSWSPATHLEMGYGRTAELSFEDLGGVGFGGFYLRWGVGVRF